MENNVTPAFIEDLKDSVINHNTRFTTQYWPNRSLMAFRRKNIKITDMHWITLRPVIDCGYTLYNPKSLIMLFLN